VKNIEKISQSVLSNHSLEMGQHNSLDQFVLINRVCLTLPLMDVLGSVILLPVKYLANAGEKIV
jgi:hypothetical protein